MHFRGILFAVALLAHEAVVLSTPAADETEILARTAGGFNATSQPEEHQVMVIRLSEAVSNPAKIQVPLGKTAVVSATTFASLKQKVIVAPFVTDFDFDSLGIFDGTGENVPMRVLPYNANGLFTIAPQNELYTISLLFLYSPDGRKYRQATIKNPPAQSGNGTTVTAEDGADNDNNDAVVLVKIF